MNQIEKVARAFPALWNLVQYHKSGGHSGSGSDRTLANALRELSAIAAMPVQAEPQWQGIESAPRDGTRFLAWCPYVGRVIMRIDGVHRETWAIDPLGRVGCNPTHWMPLPTPPAGGSDAE